MKLIVSHLTAFVMFIEMLRLSLSRPQLGHVTRLADAIITCESQKTISNLYRSFLEAPDPSAACDSLRVSSWTGKELKSPLHGFVVNDLLALAKATGAPKSVCEKAY